MRDKANYYYNRFNDMRFSEQDKTMVLLQTDSSLGFISSNIEARFTLISLCVERMCIHGLDIAFHVSARVSGLYLVVVCGTRL